VFPRLLLNCARRPVMSAATDFTVA